ncbi:MAG: hypothetical protein WBN66_06645 [Smithella sp.]
MVSCRVFFKIFVRAVFPFAALGLLSIPLLSCGVKQQTVIANGLSADEITPLSTGVEHQDAIFSALAEIDIVTSGGYYPVKAALVLKRPCYLRIELLPIIGVPDFVLTTTRDKLQIFIPSRGELYSGQPTADNLKKFLPWPMEIEDMVMILTGSFPALPGKKVDDREFREENLSRREMKAPSGRSQIIWMRTQNKPLKMLRKDEAGQELYNVQYIYEDPAGDLPRQIIIKMGDGTSSLTVKYSDVKMEKSADLSLFYLEIPANTKEITLK